MTPILLSSPPRLRLTIERGTYKHAVVRCRFEDAAGRSSCIDSRLMTKSAAIKLAKHVARSGVETEVIGWRFNMLRPPPWQCRKVRRLDEHRLNRVAQLVSAESMFADTPVTMDAEPANENSEPETPAVTPTPLTLPLSSST